MILGLLIFNSRRNLTNQARTSHNGFTQIFFQQTSVKIRKKTWNIKKKCSKSFKAINLTIFQYLQTMYTNFYFRFVMYINVNKVYFTSHELHLFQWFLITADWCNQHHKSVLEYFISPVSNDYEPINTFLTVFF